jgi:hypothetical protein
MEQPIFGFLNRDKTDFSIRKGETDKQLAPRIPHYQIIRLGKILITEFRIKH